MARPKRTTPWLARRGDPHNGTFYAFWYDAAARETKRLSMATADPGKAEVKFAEFLLGGREIRLPRPKGLTVALALADYMAEHVEKNCADTGRQEDAISHLKAFMGDRLLSEVDVPLSRQYAEARRLGQIGGGKRRTVRAGASSTIRRELNVLVAAANHAVWMKRDGAVAVSVDLPPEKRLGQDDEAPYYTLDELDRIFAAADAYDEKNKTDVSQFMHLLYQTGARRRSIEDLGRGQVRQREKQILLQKPGKRSTKKRQPIVPILKAMEPALAVLLVAIALCQALVLHMVDNLERTSTDGWGPVGFDMMFVQKFVGIVLMCGALARWGFYFDGATGAKRHPAVQFVAFAALVVLVLPIPPPQAVSARAVAAQSAPAAVIFLSIASCPCARASLAGRCPSLRHSRVVTPRLLGVSCSGCGPGAAAVVAEHRPAASAGTRGAVCTSVPGCPTPPRP